MKECQLVRVVMLENRETWTMCRTWFVKIDSLVIRKLVWKRRWYMCPDGSYSFCVLRTSVDSTQSITQPFDWIIHWQNVFHCGVFFKHFFLGKRAIPSIEKKSCLSNTHYNRMKMLENGKIARAFAYAFLQIIILVSWFKSQRNLLPKYHCVR